jgi:hypothetical protein
MVAERVAARFAEILAVASRVELPPTRNGSGCHYGSDESTKVLGSEAITFLLGFGVTVVLGLITDEWKRKHPMLVTLGHMFGWSLIGVATYMTLVDLMPEWIGSTMLPKVSMALGIILLVGGAIWAFRTPPVSVTDAMGMNATGDITAPNNSGIVTNRQTGGTNIVGR